MIYISPEKRAEILSGRAPEDELELGYTLMVLCVSYLLTKSEKSGHTGELYTSINGTLENVKQEFYKHYASKLADHQMITNGDLLVRGPSEAPKKDDNAHAEQGTDAGC